MCCKLTAACFALRGAESERAALVSAISYYQRRLLDIEYEHKTLKQKVDDFVAQFKDEDEEG